MNWDYVVSTGSVYWILVVIAILLAFVVFKKR